MTSTLHMDSEAASTESSLHALKSERLKEAEIRSELRHREIRDLLQDARSTAAVRSLDDRLGMIRRACVLSRSAFEDVVARGLFGYEPCQFQEALSDFVASHTTWDADLMSQIDLVAEFKVLFGAKLSNRSDVKVHLKFLRNMTLRCRLALRFQKHFKKLKATSCFGFGRLLASESRIVLSFKSGMTGNSSGCGAMRDDAVPFAIEFVLTRVWLLIDEISHEAEPWESLTVSSHKMSIENLKDLVDCVLNVDESSHDGGAASVSRCARLVLRGLQEEFSCLQSELIAHGGTQPVAKEVLLDRLQAVASLCEATFDEHIGRTPGKAQFRPMRVLVYPSAERCKDTGKESYFVAHNLNFDVLKCAKQRDAAELELREELERRLSGDAAATACELVAPARFQMAFQRELGKSKKRPNEVELNGGLRVQTVHLESRPVFA